MQLKMKPAQLNHLMKVTRKDEKDFKRSIKTLAKKLRDNERYHEYKHNNLEIYVTIYPGNHHTIQLTTNYFPHTFSSNPKDIGLYNKNLTWDNLQGCWGNDQKMYEFVTTHLINYKQ